MTQYATTEEKFQCIRCEIWCTTREMIDHYVSVLDREVGHCPNCGQNFGSVGELLIYDTICNK